MVNSTLYVLDTGKYVDEVARILKPIQNKNIIYVTTNKPYKHLIETFSKKKINTKNMFFIDCISKRVKEANEKEAQNCIFLDGPQGLTAISIAISESVKQLKGDKVLLLDSLSILLIYNDAVTIAKFSNFIINKMRDNGIDMVLIALESDVSKDVIKQISSIVDSVKNKN